MGVGLGKAMTEGSGEDCGAGIVGSGSGNVGAVFRGEPPPDPPGIGMPVPPLPLPPTPPPMINALPDPVLDVVPGDLFAPELDFGDPPSSSELSGLAMYSPCAGTRLLAPWGRRAGGGVGVEGPAWFVERESRGGPDISASPAPPTGARGAIDHESKWEG